MNIDLILWNITEDINEGKSVQYSNPMYCRANQEWQWRNTLFTIAM